MFEDSPVRRGLSGNDSDSAGTQGLGAVVAGELGFSKASVSVAMKKLRESGYVLMDEDGLLTLTEAGQEIASRIYARHRLLTEFFVRLGVDEKIAAADACRIEHDISEETFSKLLEHAQRSAADTAQKDS